MSTTVILPYDPTWQAVEWAKKHCNSYITNELVPNNKEPKWLKKDNRIRYYFGDEKDAVMFALRWS